MLGWWVVRPSEPVYYMYWRLSDFCCQKNYVFQQTKYNQNFKNIFGKKQTAWQHCRQQNVPLPRNSTQKMRTLVAMPYHMTTYFMVYRWCLTHFFINLFNLLPSSQPTANQSARNRPKPQFYHSARAESLRKTLVFGQDQILSIPLILAYLKPINQRKLSFLRTLPKFWI